jgi:hypothetical protein
LPPKVKEHGEHTDWGQNTAAQVRSSTGVCSEGGEPALSPPQNKLLLEDNASKMILTI